MLVTLSGENVNEYGLLMKSHFILFFVIDEDWQAAKKQVNSKMHILDPMGIDMKLQKALNPDDIRLAQ